MSATMSPCVVGSYRDAGEPRFLPMSEAEIVRSARHYQQVLQSYDLGARTHVLLVSLASQVSFVMPLERAIANLHLVVSYADASQSDAARVVALTRQFDVRAILGVTDATLRGLSALECDPAALFAGRLVWADLAAYAQLAPANGYLLRLWTPFGPAVGVECAAGGGPHVAGEEWSVDCLDGEVRMTSRLPRLSPFDAQRTGVEGTLVAQPCDCGSPDVRIRCAMPRLGDGR